jgi:hypothetical protein
MSISKEYLLLAVGWRKWARFCDQVRLPKDELHRRLVGLTMGLHEQLPIMAKACVEAGLNRKVVKSIAAALERRAAECTKELAT